MIHAICTCAISQIDRLPQLVQHYRGLGIDRFWLTVHDDASEAIRRDARHTESVIAQLGLAQIHYLAGDFDAELLRDHHDRIQARHVAADDWVCGSTPTSFKFIRTVSCVSLKTPTAEAKTR